MNEACNSTFYLSPGDPGEVKFQLQSQYIDIKHKIFILSPGSCPRGGTGGRSKLNFFRTWLCGISN